MGKPTKRKHAQDVGKFAESVNDLYEATLVDHWEERHLKTNDDVRRVAFGLVALRQAIDVYLSQQKNKPVQLAAAGLFEADRILEALITGRHHPIWYHVKGVMRRYRMGSMPPVVSMQRGRNMLVGAVLAYQKAAEVKAAEARRAIAAGIQSEDFAFGADQLKEWSSPVTKEAQAFAEQFHSMAAEDAELKNRTPGDRVIIVARSEIHASILVPAVILPKS